MGCSKHVGSATVAMWEGLLGNGKSGSTKRVRTRMLQPPWVDLAEAFEKVQLSVVWHWVICCRKCSEFFVVTSRVRES